ncbi:leucine-rich repeat (LRR) family protein [Tasmannia lanceolata]|uniref:leucine-rich repeat (LRR) family protein n=1 Tax=Tasmannia lanceolata TaxID=3420 RepID=UPI004063DBE6
MTRLSSAQLPQENQNEDIASISSLELSHRALSDVSYLTGFTNLERLDLSSNKLLTLEGLESCINLKWLSAVQNKLQSLKGIECLSKLTVLNAGRNKLRSMDEVKSLINLRALILNDNDIASICRLDQLMYLNTLVLSRNPIRDIGDSLVKVKSIRKLSLANCQVQMIGSSLIFCTDLKEVRLSHNEITTFPAEFAHNVKIQNLDLGNNLIKNWSDLKVLSSLHNLKNLNLQGNPVAGKDKLANKIKKLMPNLQIFNNKPTERGGMNETSKKDISSPSKDYYSPNIATDLEAVKEAKREESRANEKVPKKDGSSHNEDWVPYNASKLDVERNVKRKTPDKNEIISKKNVSSHSKDDHDVDLGGEKKVKRSKAKNVGESKLEGIDDGDTPFVELIFSDSSRNLQDSERKKRDHESIQDVKSLSGLVAVHSKKKKTTKSTGTGRSAPQFLLQTSEVGMGGPSTWDA